MLLFWGKVYVPRDEAIRRDIVWGHHDSLLGGHPSHWKTYELVSHNYWWPGMSNFVECYVPGCDTCAHTKNIPRRQVGPLQPNAVPVGPWQSITCNFVTKTEHVNQEMEQYLRAFTDVQQENWSALLPMAEFTHNTHAHSATHSSPFAMLYGYDPEFMIGPSEHLSTVPATDEHLKGLCHAQDDSKAALEVACFDSALGRMSSRPWIKSGELRVSGNVLGSTPS